MEIIINNYVRMEVKNDGVYLILHNDEDGTKPTRMEIISILEGYGIQDIDFKAISDIYKSDDDVIVQKISSNTKILQEAEDIKISVEKGNLEAYIKFIPPTNHGTPATLQDIKNAVTKANINFGIIDGILEELAEERTPNRSYLLAVGENFEDGKDGYLEYHFDISKKSRKPKTLKDGTVDYKNLDLIDMVQKGEKLVTAHPAINGKDGKNVFGAPIPCKKPKPAPPLPKGKNTTISASGLELYSEISGQIIFDGRKVNISPMLEVAGNIDNATGDINFNGSVVIRGNVLTGFTVIADGDIEVFGVVEGAKIKSAQNIILNSGVQGQEKADINAGGNLTVKYAESCTLTAGKDIFADSILHSTVKCGGSLELRGRKGLLVGGYINVGQKINAKVIGSTMATATTLQVGFNPEVLDTYKELMNEYNLIKNEYDKIDKIVDNLNTLNKETGLSEDKKNILLKTIHTKMFLREKLNIAQEKINKIAPSLEQNRGYVGVSEVIRSGVKIIIGNAVMFVRDDISHCSFRNVDSKISIGSYS